MFKWFNRVNSLRISDDYFKPFSPLSNCLNRPAQRPPGPAININVIQWRHYPKTRQWFWLFDCLTMRNFSRMVVWYQTDRILGMLACCSNISTICMVNRKITLVLDVELLNWTANEEYWQRVGRFFIKSRFVVSAVTLFVQSFLGFKS